jgi:hypothetical protein
MPNFDSGPAFVLPEASTVLLAENSAAGTLVYTFNVTDEDGDTNSTFSIASQSVPNAFTTNQNTQVVVAAAMLDFESEIKQYNITLQ